MHEHKARSDDEMETANQLIHFIDLSCLCRAKFIYEKRFGNERERIIQIGLVSVGGWMDLRIILQAIIKHYTFEL